MKVAAEELQELTEFCGDVRELTDAGKTFIYLPKLTLPNGSVVEGLLCPETHTGYATRLFLSQSVPRPGLNWLAYQIAARTWYSWSWKDVGSHLRLAQMLAEHVRALR